MASDRRPDTDEDVPPEIIDRDVPVAAAACDILTTTEPVLTRDAEMNTDDLCTQMFDADDDHGVTGDVIAAETGRSLVKSEDDLPKQVFNELPEKMEALTNKVKKGGRGGNRAKKTGKNGARKAVNEKLDSLETQVFDSFVPPAPPSGKSGLFQSDEVADVGVDKSEVVSGARQTRGRMSLRGLHRAASDLTPSDKPLTVASASDASPKSNTLTSSADDLATQVFEADAADGGISVAGSLENVATQTFDNVPSDSSSMGLQEIAGRPAVSFDGPRLNSNTEDVETQVFEAIDPDRRSAVHSRSSKQDTELTDTGRRTSGRTAGRLAKKSVGRKWTDSAAEADIAAERMDDVVTQMIDAEPCSKLSKGLSAARSEAGVDDSDAGKSRASRAKSSSCSETATTPDEVQKQEVEDTKSAAADGASKSRRLSCRASRGRSQARDALLPAVPEDAGAEKQRTGRSQGNRLRQTTASVEEVAVQRSSNIQPPSHEVTKPGDTSVAEPADVGRLRPARSQAKRAKQMNPSLPDDASEPPADVRLLHPGDAEASGKRTARRRKRKESTTTGKAAQSHVQGDKLASDDIDGADVLMEEPSAVVEVVRKTPTKRERKKTVHKLYTAKGLRVFANCNISCFL